MKLIAKFALVAVLLSTVFGCATSGDKFETRLDPPDDFKKAFMHYKELPGNKVIVVAVDPLGHWAYGFDDSQSDTREAAKNAAIKCNEAREKFNVLNKPNIFAVNDDVIYYDKFK